MKWYHQTEYILKKRKLSPFISFIWAFLLVVGVGIAITSHSIATAIANSTATVNDVANANPILFDQRDAKVVELIEQNKLSQARELVSAAIDQTNFTVKPNLLINRLMLRATIDQKVGANISALQDLQFAYRLAANSNQQNLLGDVAYAIANIHQTRSEHSIALSYFKQSSDHYFEQGQIDRYTSTLLKSVTSLLATEQVEAAFAALDKSKSLLNVPLNSQSPKFNAEEQNLQGVYFLHLGEALLASQQFTGSIEALKTSLELLLQEELITRINVNLLLSKAYAADENIDLAIERLVLAFDLSSQAETPIWLMHALQLHRANLLAQLNEYEAAFAVTQGLLQDRTMLQPISEIKQMLDMHANFQLANQQQENANLKQENEIKSEEIANKQTLNQLYFLVIALLFCLSCLLLLLFIRSRKHRKALEEIAHTDALTKLYSRTRILDLLSHHQDLYSRNPQAYCVAIVDLDHFKQINDTYGHPTGDKVLKAFGEIAKVSFRKSDLVGRIGGEEFLIILPNTLAEKATEVFNAFNSKLPKISYSLNIEQTITASIGVVSPQLQETFMDIVSRADKALYTAKENGRNQVVFANN